MDGINCLISPARDIYEPGIIEKPAKYHRSGARLRNRRKTWAGLMDRPQSAPGEAFFMRFADISEDEVLVSNGDSKILSYVYTSKILSYFMLFRVKE